MNSYIAIYGTPFRRIIFKYRCRRYWACTHQYIGYMTEILNWGPVLNGKAEGQCSFERMSNTPCSYAPIRLQFLGSDQARVSLGAYIFVVSMSVKQDAAGTNTTSKSSLSARALVRIWFAGYTNFHTMQALN